MRLKKVFEKLQHILLENRNIIATKFYNVFGDWPALDKRFLLVGSESSGTTAIAQLLFVDTPGLRFLDEGDEKWVWDAYKNIYTGQRTILDYPRLRIFNAVKVPGFAVILKQYLSSYPNSSIIYIVRDPRDVVNSAIKTWKIDSVPELANISWSKENWLDIPNSDPVERLAERWRKYLNSTNDLKSRIIYLKYEDFCADKVGTIEKVANELGIAFDKERVHKLAFHQLSRKSVRNYTPAGPGGWKTGILEDEHIAKIETICQQEMQMWGYPKNKLPHDD